MRRGRLGRERDVRDVRDVMSPAAGGLIKLRRGTLTLKVRPDLQASTFGPRRPAIVTLWLKLEGNLGRRLKVQTLRVPWPKT